MHQYEFKQMRDGKVVNHEICSSSASEFEVFDWLVNCYFIHDKESYYFKKLEEKVEHKD